MLLNEAADPNLTEGPYGSGIAALLQRPFNKSVFGDDLLCLELLLSNGAKANLRMNNGKQALHAAAEYCHHTEVFEMLLRYGADVNATFQSHELGFEVTTTPLGILCKFSTVKEAAMVLLKAGASPNCYTPTGKTVLQSACGNLGSTKIAQGLIRRGADINARSLREGATALHSAATAARSGVIKNLIEKGANVAAQDKWKRTPLHDVCWRGPERESRQEKEENPFESLARPSHTKKGFELVQSIELLLALGHANPKARDEDGATPLHLAVKACDSISVETLIRLTSHDIVLERDCKGKLPLHWAAEADFTDGLCSLVDFLSHPKAVYGSKEIEKARAANRALKKHINARDKSGNTALHYAAKNGHEKFVAKLLLGQIFTDTNVRDCDGHTALYLAKKNEQVWVVAEFIDALGTTEARHSFPQGFEHTFQPSEAESSVESSHGREDTSPTLTVWSEAGSESDTDSLERKKHV